MRWSAPCASLGFDLVLDAMGDVIATCAGAVVAFSRFTGSRIKAIQVGGWAGCPSIADGTVLVGSDDGRLYGIDVNSARVKWKTDPLGPMQGCAAVVPEAKTLVFVGAAKTALASGGIASVDPGSGALRWLNRDYSIRGNLTWSSVGSVIGLAKDGNVYALDAADGTLRWMSPTGSAGSNFPYDVAVGEDGTVFSGSDQGFAALDGASGMVHWRRAFGAAFGPALTSSKALILGNGRELLTLSSATGEVISQASLADGERIGAISVDQSGRVFAGTQSRFYSFGN